LDILFEVDETVLYSGMDERENQERRDGLILSRYAAQSQLESGLETVSKRIIRFRFNSR